MGKIHKLPEHIANKIAAGEVVERPASVVKELVENSIDAGADSIEIIIEKAGKERIEVIDNGTGMSPEDAQLAFERHATSKIQNEEDLYKIGTLGFRGEALPSIASVSHVEVKTREKGQEFGYHLHLTGGILDWVKPVQMHEGTHITVKNLFFNTPARRNFLRSDTSELQHILSLLKKFFVSFPTIAFKVWVNQKLIYDLAKGTLDQRLVQVLGKYIYDGFIHFQEHRDNAIVEGYIARPDLARNSRGMEFLFLNNRPFENRSLHFAIIQAYGNSIERRQYPPYVLYISLDPAEVDVNVHPTKMEVKFRNEQKIFQLIHSGVKKALNRQSVIPSLGSKEESSFHFSSEKVVLQKGLPQKFTFTRQQRIDFTLPDESTENSSYPLDPFSQIAESFGGETSAVEKNFSSPESMFVLFQLHNRYILAQSEQGLLIIDQHVAHERILYEKASLSLNTKNRFAGQQLLFPQTVDLPLEDFLIFQEIRDSLYLLGFGVNELSGRTVVIESIPAVVKPGLEPKILLEIIDYYKQFDKVRNTNVDAVAAAFACKNAVKSGDRLSQEEMEYLLAELFRCREPFFCPHGRPVIVALTMEELDKKFKRIK